MYNDKMSVKIGPATTLREVRDQVCEKRRLDREAYGLELNGKALELTQTAFGINLQQGTKLDLVKVASGDPGTVLLPLSFFWALTFLSFFFFRFLLVGLLNLPVLAMIPG